MNVKYKRSLAITGIVIGFIPILYYALWIYISGLYHNQAESVTEFSKFLPAIFSNMRVATILFIFLCIISISLNLSGVRQSSKILKYCSLAMILVCVALIMLFAFSLL